MRQFRTLDERWAEAISLRDEGDATAALYLFKKLASEGEIAAMSQASIKLAEMKLSKISI
jgi:hypothetical protein